MKYFLLLATAVMMLAASTSHAEAQMGFDCWDSYYAADAYLDTEASELGTLYWVFDNSLDAEADTAIDIGYAYVEAMAVQDPPYDAGMVQSSVYQSLGDLAAAEHSLRDGIDETIAALNASLNALADMENGNDEEAVTGFADAGSHFVDGFMLFSQNMTVLPSDNEEALYQLENGWGEDPGGMMP